ncbi:MAG: S-methyl-5-thioribose-1-phosphate isomerase, partial [Betaproteobacteria bacterium]|nr:S-methyl-5-thioribose-1-phosphate isomerase [Betaproteobacteria bacterium]
ALLASRPTAVNLAWAVNQVIRAVEVAASELHQQGSRLLADRAWQRAIAIVEEDRVCNAAIGIQTQKVLLEHAAGRDASKPFQILTHCNAGSLATVDWGTATAAIYQLHAQGFALHVWVDETRPRNQGASLTAYELADAGIPHTVIADNAGGLLMMKGWVDAVIVGCDRVCANGDVVNKIGTYLKALSAKAHGVPFWVACPESSIDMNCPSGMQVTIEERSSLELSQIRGRPLASGKGNGAADAGGGGDGGCDVGGGDEVGGGDDGQLRKPILVEIMQAGQACYNPGFDITPAALVSGLITEAAVLNPMRLREALA